MHIAILISTSLLLLPRLLAAHPQLSRDLPPRSVPPMLQDISITIPSSFLPAPFTYFWTYEAQTSNAVPYAQIVSWPEGLLAPVLMPPFNLGDTGWNLAGVDQLTSTISVNSNNLGFLAFIDENTRELSGCQIDFRNSTVIVTLSSGPTETVVAQVSCSTPYPA